MSKNAFRKRTDFKSYNPPGSDPKVVTFVTKTVSTKECPEPTTFIEKKVMSVDDYANRLGLPRDEDYQLRDMIASGRIPEEVPCTGMLDSNDPLDSSNFGVGDAILDKLSHEVDSKASAAVSEPAPTSTPPSNE